MSYAAERIADRRRAVAMLERQRQGYTKRHAYAAAAAMRRAMFDTQYALRDDAAYLIEEGMHMSFAHDVYPTPAQVAA